MNDHPITMSLVLATLGRTDPISAFLDSLASQCTDGVDVVIVDQNPDDRVVRLLAARRDAVRIRRVTSRPGVSLARNVGVAASNGSILGFPDDDCWYPGELLDHIRSWFTAHPQADGLSCRVSDPVGRASAGGYMSGHRQVVSRRNVWRCVVSPGLFVRRHLHARVGGFDERLGVGAGTPWGSAEESDYVLRSLSHGARIHYEPDLAVIHPCRPERLCAADVRRGWSYGQGVGFVLARNGSSAVETLYYASLPLGSAALATARGQIGRACARVGMSAGRCVGWCRARWQRADSSLPHVDAVNQGIGAP